MVFEYYHITLQECVYESPYFFFGFGYHTKDVRGRGDCSVYGETFQNLRFVRQTDHSVHNNRILSADQFECSHFAHRQSGSQKTSFDLIVGHSVVFSHVDHILLLSK